MASRPDTIDPEVASEYLQLGRAQLLDARPELAWRQSREAIPDAVHVDPGGGAATSDVLFALPRERLFIAYCDEPGESASAHVARLVRELGIGDGCYLAGGLQRWREASLPIEVTFAVNHQAAAHDGRHDGSYRIERAPDQARLTVPASSAEEMFVGAARAVMDVVLDSPRAGEAPGVELAVQARTREALLALWVEEILAHARAAARLYRQVAILSLTARELRAGLAGAADARWRVAPAATAVRDVSEESGPAGFAARMAAIISLDLGAGGDRIG